MTEIDTSRRTVEAAIAKFGLLSEPRLSEAVETLLASARKCDGIEVGFPDWPEADEAVKRHPKKLAMSGSRGPDGWWRRLAYLDDEVTE